VIAWGADPEQALLRLELVEHLARIAIEAMPLGGVEPLPAAAIKPLLQARAKANIGRAADRAVDTADKLLGETTVQTVVACAPAPHANVATMSPSGQKHDLAAVVREEIVRAMRKP